MSNRARTVRSGDMRSNAVPSTSRRPQSITASPRPQLHVVSDTGKQRNAVTGGLTRLVVWTRSRSTSLFHIVIAALFLAATLVGALVLRTQMVENSFEAASVQANITQLTQDVEEDQAKLDALEASLPDKAEQLGMVLQQGSLSIDLNGYKPAESSNTASHNSNKTNEATNSEKAGEGQ